jgi:hypothetical protein
MLLLVPLLVPRLSLGGARRRTRCWVQIAKTTISRCARPALFESAVLAIQIYLARSFIYRGAPRCIAKSQAGGNIETHCRN